ncbi:hypothetical protein Aperf_G00000118026 [Anoplocephala perfoliata]
MLVANRRPTSSAASKLKEGQFAASRHRRKLSLGVLSCIQRYGKEELSDEEEEEGKAAIKTISGEADQTSIEDGPAESLSSLSEHTFNVDPSISAARSPRGLEAEIRSLRRQLEEFRAFSARQERERLQQADEIQQLAEEIRNLKAWKASILLRGGINQHSAAGDLPTSSNSPPKARNISPSLSTLVGLNRSAITENDVGISEVLQKEEEEVGREEMSDQEEVEVESPLQRPSSFDLNGTLLTANLSTDSLDTRRSRLSTPLSFENAQLIYSVNMDDGQLMSESTLVPANVTTPV